MTFDDLRYEEHHSKTFKFDFKKLPPTSESINKHIRHVFYEYYMWINTARNKSMFLDPFYYGYTLDDNEALVADISSSELSDAFPLLCTCGKCARDNVCPCRIKSFGCCQYCKCSKRESKTQKQQKIYD